MIVMFINKMRNEFTMALQKCPVSDLSNDLEEHS